MRPGYQAGTGAVAINPKPSTGQVFAILCGLRQADSARIGCTQFEIGIEIPAGSIVQGNGCLVAGDGHIPQIIGGAGSGGQIPGCLVHSGGRNRAGLGNIQGTATLVELRSISVCEREVGQNAVAVLDAGFFSCQTDGRSAAAGGTCEAGNLLCCLDVGNQRIVVGSKIGN